MILNMGPQHPSTHGVLRVLLEIDGETIVRLMPDIGFLHTGIEKTCEAKFYQQVVPLTDRIDYLCPMTNNLCYVLAVEKLLGLEIPPKAQWLRVLLNELTRINSHLVWLGTHAMDIGALTVFLYCFREREEILKIFEMVSGQRMMTSYFRVGGHCARTAAWFLRPCPRLRRIFPGEGGRIREPAHRKSDLDDAHQRRGEDDGRRRHRPGRQRPDPARQRRRHRPAPRHAVLQLREISVQGARVAGRRRLRPVYVPRAGTARIDRDRPTGARRHARRSRSRPTLPEWCSPTAKK